MSDVSPASGFVAVTPADGTDLPGGICKSLLVTTAGLAKLTDAKGNVSTSVPLQAGYNPIKVARVWSTGTAATGIFALYD